MVPHDLLHPLFNWLEDSFPFRICMWFGKQKSSLNSKYAKGGMKVSTDWFPPCCLSLYGFTIFLKKWIFFINKKWKMYTLRSIIKNVDFVLHWTCTENRQNETLLFFSSSCQSCEWWKLFDGKGFTYFFLLSTYLNFREVVSNTFFSPFLFSFLRSLSLPVCFLSLSQSSTVGTKAGGWKAACMTLSFHL